MQRNKDVQQRSLNLSTKFSQKVLQQDWLNETTKKQLAQVHSEAKQHYNVIQKFGRFPHRNQVLNLKSKLEKKQFILQRKSFT
ncbi:DUF924 family protein [Okeania sp. SIO2B3]|uniref:DUF924 family protein n=1 Tax=Okeania sp. SIO2B3 TaxID=2607784 RepID=UPI003446D115